MSHDNISDIRKVLYGDLNPQLPDVHDEDYYVPELRQLPRTEPIYTSLCRLSFQVPAPSTKVQYYCSRIDIKAKYDSKYGAPSAGNPKVFFKYFYVNTATGEKSGDVLVQGLFMSE